MYAAPRLFRKVTVLRTFSSNFILLRTCPRLRVSAGHVAAYLGEMTNFTLRKKRRRGDVELAFSRFRKYSNDFEGPFWYTAFSQSSGDNTGVGRRCPADSIQSNKVPPVSTR